ncbi:PAS domain S-box [Desulfocapsa sulfexigens DSM 10523]|uniref:histidine kinase n=1 Tax=Desulfocapsa sulfexigens (strain DSM 10523 / SB164P1) TaxID=1167006 RepID=M1P006_DESSD|nr:ATP-binding protein [Desulfocapsa sulfexigens]AGF76853.1 PAS domain S-box [Desulfocapsa sulfexigens DSM 10523]
MKKPANHSFVLLVLLFLLLSPLTVIGQPKDTAPRVLILLSYDQKNPWTAALLEGLEAGLATAEPEPELYIEYMDSKRHSQEVLFSQLKKLYRTKYGAMTFDLIILGDNNAFDFFLPLRTSLFPGVPVVFCGVNNFFPASIEGHDKITGVVEKSNILETIQLALSLQPDTRHVAVLSDNTPTGLAYRKELLESMSALGNRVSFIDLFNQTEKELIRSLADLPQKSIVLLISFYRDRNGKQLSIREQLQLIQNNTSHPVYALWDLYLGRGIVGGALSTGHSQGKDTALLGLRILAGEDMNQLSVLQTSPNIPTVDYRMMQQHGLALKRLPEGTVILNKPGSFYSDHKQIIWLTLLLLLLQTLIIVFLIHTIRRRRLAELQLQEQKDHLQDLVTQQTAELSATNTELLEKVTSLNNSLQQEENLTRIIEDSLNEIFLFDTTSYKFVFVNTGALQNIGYTMDELLEMTPLDIKPDIKKASFEEIIAPLLSKKQENVVFETLHRRKDGSTYTVEIHLQQSVYRSQPVFVSIGLDVTERNKREEALLQSNGQWDRTFNSFTDIVTLQDKDLLIIKANQAACTTLELPCDSIVGRHCYELFHGASEICPDCPTLETQKSLKPYSREIYHEKLNKTFLVSAAPVLDSQGKLEYIAHVAKDITAWKQLEDRLLLSEKMTSVAGLAAGVAHEINTPLSGILQSEQLIRMGLSPDTPPNLKVAEKHGVNLSSVQAYMKEQELDFFMDGIRSSALKASQIIKSLLDFSRPQDGSFSTSDTNALVKDAVALAKSDYNLRKKHDIININIVEEYDRNLPLLFCAKVEIEQVLLNLIKNAVQAMAENKMRKPRLILRTLQVGEVIRIEVEDNGPGMENGLKKQIFNPFFTTKEIGEGTGLGLSVSYTIICEKHHGKIWVESEAGKGARFVVELPIKQ